MKYLNLETGLLTKAEVMQAENPQLGGYFRLLLWCAVHETGGRISEARSWSSRQVSLAAGFSSVRWLDRLVDASLADWDGNDLVLRWYPREQEDTYRQKCEVARENGRLGGRRPRVKIDPRADGRTHGGSAAEPKSETDIGTDVGSSGESVREGNVKESNRKSEGLTTNDALQRTLSDIQSRWPGVDVRREAEKAEAHCRRKYGRPGFESDWFEGDWLPKAASRIVLEPAGRPASAGADQQSIEPRGWREFIDRELPDSVYATGGEQADKPWADLDPVVRAHILRQMGAREDAA